MLSIVIPTYNCAAYIGDAIRSCLRQAEQSELEVIVVDDGSTDETQRVLARFSTDRRVRILSQENAGCGAARNLGIEQCRGEFIGFLDADDAYLPRTIERFQAAIPLLPATLGFAYCDYARVEPGRGAPLRVSVREPLNRPQLYWQYLLPEWFPVLMSTTLVRREALMAVGLFDPSFIRLQDFELWTRMVPTWDVAKIRCCATLRRIRPGQATEDKLSLKVFRERCNTQFLARHPFSFFSGVDEPSANAHLAERFGDLFLQAKRPLPQSAAACYRIAHSFAPTLAVEAKIAALAAASHG